MQTNGENVFLKKVSLGASALRGIMVIPCDAHLNGGHKLAVWPSDATVCFVVLFYPRSILILYLPHTVCTEYSTGSLHLHVIMGMD